MLTSTTTTMIRSGLTRCNLQPVLLRTTACPYSTLTSTPLGLRPKVHEQPPIKPKTTSRFVQKRPASTSTAQQDAMAAAAASASQTAARPDLAVLDWNTFFKLRKTRRRWQLAFSVASCLSGGTGGAVFLGSGAADPVVSQIPLDPFLTLGLMTFGFAALGWLAGPSMGSFIFNMLNRKYIAQMTVKESQFFARIKKNRVDPSSSSTANPVPDFYGEKISSVAGYRQWLKDQRAFNKKRSTFV